MMRWMLILLAATVILHWFTMSKLILDEETVIRKGKAYKFETEPIDPSDPFRGKYIWLRFKESTVKVFDAKEWEDASSVYVTFLDSAGYALIDRVSMYEPEGNDYLKVPFDLLYQEPAALELRYPFNKYFLEESKAPEAERAYAQAQSDSALHCYGNIHIWKGKAAITGVFINDQPIERFVRRE